MDPSQRVRYRFRSWRAPRGLFSLVLVEGGPPAAGGWDRCAGCYLSIDTSAYCVHCLQHSCWVCVRGGRTCWRCRDEVNSGP